jgi:hypothetical protein
MSEQITPIEKKRHSLAHLLAATLMEMYPSVRPTLGPAVDTGFYYDFDFGSDLKISDKDLPKIEKKMREILKYWKMDATITNKHFALRKNPEKNMVMVTQKPKKFWLDRPYCLFFHFSIFFGVGVGCVIGFVLYFFSCVIIGYNVIAIFCG